MVNSCIFRSYRGVNRNSHSIERLQKSILVSFISNQLAAVMITKQKVLLISVTPPGLSNTVTQ